MATSAQAMKGNPLAALVPLEHTDFGTTGIPYYDEELDVAQGHPQADMVRVVSSILEYCAPEGWSTTSDNPIWIIDPETHKQRAIFPDFTVLAKPKNDRMRATIKDVRLVIEIVTTSTKEKERKDTLYNKELYFFNQAPEFLLLYPDLDDNRVMEWYRWSPEGFQDIQPNEKGVYYSRMVKGLSIQPLPKDEWEYGQKIRFFHNGIPMGNYREIYTQKETAEAQVVLHQAYSEKNRKEMLRERAEKERLLKLLLKAGIDPDAQS